MSERRPQTEAELVEFLRLVDLRAPEELHERIQTLVDERSPRGRRRRRGARTSRLPLSLDWRIGGGVAVLAAAVIALVIGLSGGGSGALNVREASASTLRPATMAAPTQSPSGRAQLAAAVEGVTFPYWEDRFGWRSTGARADRVAGRAVATVFYANGRGQRIGYAIFAGTPPPEVSASGGVFSRGGTPYRLSSNGDLRVVSWVRDGHLCVVAGRDVNGATLLRLASWNDRSDAA
jgi:hypothetical protein